MRDYLKNKRTEMDKTQAEIAKELEVSESYYNLIERGLRQKILRTDTVCKLSQILNIPIEEIIENERIKEG